MTYLVNRVRHAFGLVFVLLLFPTHAALANSPRIEIPLADAWRTTFEATNSAKHDGFIATGFDDSAWLPVEVPHNWDNYYGTRLVKNGNLHGHAWYRRTFATPTVAAANTTGERRVFLFFEGVGSYATVWVNGQLVGRHAGGLTTFTLDVTEALHREAGAANVLAVRADHPAGIRDLPWVGGGSERVYGFSEGSQPFGIFRPVHLVVTDSLRIEPFGVHAWNDRTVSPTRATAHLGAEIKNYGAHARTFTLRHRVLDATGETRAETRSTHTLAAGATLDAKGATATITSARLWSLDDPYLYTIATEILDEQGAVIDRLDTPYGFRWIDWPHGDDAARGTFLLNGKPVFLNGTCEYQHLLGGSHAFTAEQIAARVKQITSAGFNAFRDAHHPHNLRYQEHWDRAGVAWWTQFGAHIWFDNDAFRANFKTLLREWVRERRNSPSLVLWGLQNESELPADFSRECAEIIRALDPTCGPQRLVTTCNGGEGVDWDVPQNWSGTYGGDPLKYGEELTKQLLVGEYGAWRSLGLHAEGDGKHPAGDSETYMTALLETKVRLAETVRDRAAGHFQWIFSTHENPGRNFGARGEQFADGWSPLDRIGPANNKGLLTLWGEPLDVYYMYRANYAPATTQPMVVIAGSTWPDRWTKPGRVDGIIVYSNCDEVELFNGTTSLGTRTRGARGTHFRWDGVELRVNELRAVARVGGREVARDAILLHHLLAAPEAGGRLKNDTTTPAAGQHYLYRVNAGGPDYTDEHGHRWLADRAFVEGDSWGSVSWSAQFPHLDPALASRRDVNVPIGGTHDDTLYQTFRYGREKLRYRFAVPDGRYRVELHFAEPWYGRGGGVDARGWRLFDVAINGETKLANVDLFAETGFAHALVKVIEADIRGGWLEISFPRVASYQAVINALAISRAGTPSPNVSRNADLLTLENQPGNDTSLESWLTTGVNLFTDVDATLAALPEMLRFQSWIYRASTPAPLAFTLNRDSDIYAATPAPCEALVGWEDTGETLQLAYHYERSATLKLFRRHGKAGERFAFTALPEFTAFIAAPTLPLPPAQAIRELRVDGAPASAPWRTVGNLRRGDRLYRADGPALTKLPSDLTDSDWLRTPAENSAAQVHVQFSVADHVEVYVALDARIATPPTWLAGWVAQTNDMVAGPLTFKLYRQRYEQGATVTLGRNPPLADGTPAAMYGVIVRPVRPATTYAPPPPAQRTLVPGQSWTWTIEVGVGSRYGFVFEHDIPVSAETRVRYEFTDRVGTVLCTEDFNLGGATANPSSPLRVRTCESFNAGTYQVRLTVLSGANLTLGRLTVE